MKWIILKCLSTGNSESHVIGKRSIKLAVKLNSKIKQIILINVSYNPHLRSNLLLELKLEEAGAHLVGSNGKIWVYSNEWKYIYIAKKHNGLYYHKLMKYVKKIGNLNAEMCNNFGITKYENDKNGLPKLWHCRHCE